MEEELKEVVQRLQQQLFPPPPSQSVLDKQNIEANLISYSLLPARPMVLHESRLRPLNLNSLCVCNTHGRLHSYLLRWRLAKVLYNFLFRPFKGKRVPGTKNGFL